jgi:hypothetical protein
MPSDKCCLDSPKIWIWFPWMKSIDYIITESRGVVLVSNYKYTTSDQENACSNSITHTKKLCSVPIQVVKINQDSIEQNSISIFHSLENSTYITNICRISIHWTKYVYKISIPINIHVVIEQNISHYSLITKYQSSFTINKISTTIHY